MSSELQKGSKPITGGCHCGAVRYQVDSEPVLSLICFCSACQSIFGCDGYPGMMVQEDGFTRTDGQTTQFTRGSDARRQVILHFCPTCGTTLWGQTELGLVSIAAGTLDNPDLFVPTKAVFTEQAPSWARLPEHLELE